MDQDQSYQLSRIPTEEKSKLPKTKSANPSNWPILLILAAAIIILAVLFTWKANNQQSSAFKQFLQWKKLNQMQQKQVKNQQNLSQLKLKEEDQKKKQEALKQKEEDMQKQKVQLEYEAKEKELEIKKQQLQRRLNETKQQEEENIKSLQQRKKQLERKQKEAKKKEEENLKNLQQRKKQIQIRENEAKKQEEELQKNLEQKIKQLQRLSNEANKKQEAKDLNEEGKNIESQQDSNKKQQQQIVPMTEQEKQKQYEKDWKKLDQSLSNQEAFTHIYQKNLWNGGADAGEHPSGGGSVPRDFYQYLLILQHLVDHPSIKTIVEVGFGDFNMTGSIYFYPDRHYIGYDVVPKLMRPNTTNKEFRLYSNIRELNQTADLLICRQVMQHWPNSEITYFMDEVVPRFKYALIGNDEGPADRPDIPFGGWAPVNLDAWQPKEPVHSQNMVRYYIFPRWPVYTN